MFPIDVCSQELSWKFYAVESREQQRQNVKSCRDGWAYVNFHYEQSKAECSPPTVAHAFLLSPRERIMALGGVD